MDAAATVMRRLAERVTEAGRSRSPLEIRGGGTKSFYGNEPRGSVLDMRELSGISSYEPSELVVTALAGTPLAELEAALAECGQCLPFEPPRFAPGGTVGGMVAGGLAGPARAAVGPLVDYVLGVTVMNGRAEILTFGGQVMKNVAGFDVSRVMAGSMGILGLLCEVSLKVMPVLPARRTVCVELSEAAALDQLHRWSGQSFPLNASAWFEGRLWIRVAGAIAAVAHACDVLGSPETSPADADAWWEGLRDQRHAFFQLSPADLSGGECLWRVAVPDTAPPLALPGSQLIEWGGAQRWWRTRAPAREIRAAASAAGGHATLVRGADKTAGAFAAPGEAIMHIHRRLKDAFDPAGIFNPGRLYPEL